MKSLLTAVLLFSSTALAQYIVNPPQILTDGGTTAAISYTATGAGGFTATNGSACYTLSDGATWCNTASSGSDSTLNSNLTCGAGDGGYSLSLANGIDITSGNVMINGGNIQLSGASGRLYGSTVVSSQFWDTNNFANHFTLSGSNQDVAYTGNIQVGAGDGGPSVQIASGGGLQIGAGNVTPNHCHTTIGACSMASTTTCTAACTGCTSSSVCVCFGATSAATTNAVGTYAACSSGTITITAKVGTTGTETFSCMCDG